MNPYHLLIIGFDEIVENKYLAEVERAARTNCVLGYSVVDLESQRDSISERVEQLEFEPEVLHYLDDDSEAAIRKSFVSFFYGFIEKHHSIRVYIATEVRAHEFYLRFFSERGIPTLVEKPVFAPMSSGRFRANLLSSTLSEIVNLSGDSSDSHSVMTLSRYHRIYNDLYINPLARLVDTWKAPVTSLHLRHSGGVWNRQAEYDWREDHPYKYGYGMMMHGAYHYVDLAAQILNLNRSALGDVAFRFCAKAYTASPTDQWCRVPKQASAMLGDDDPNWGTAHTAPHQFGETDLVATFRVITVPDYRVVTLGTMAFEQTTPSIRSWGEFPNGLYNKNGRSSMVDIETQLSVIHASHVRVYDVPVEGAIDGEIPRVDRIDAFARIERRSNGSLAPSLPFLERETYGGLFHSDSNKALMRHWLAGQENRSCLASHHLTVQLIQALLEAAALEGEEVCFDF